MRSVDPKLGSDLIASPPRSIDPAGEVGLALAGSTCHAAQVFDVVGLPVKRAVACGTGFKRPCHLMHRALYRNDGNWF
jgi:hypothetical protein